MSWRLRQTAAFALCLAAGYLTLATGCVPASSTVLLDGQAQFAAGQGNSSLRFEVISGGSVADLAIRTDPDVAMEVAARNVGDGGMRPLRSKKGVLRVDCREVNCHELTVSVLRKDAAAAREVQLEFEAVVLSNGCGEEPVGFVEMRLAPVSPTDARSSTE